MHDIIHQLEKKREAAAWVAARSVSTASTRRAS
jgi:hypothetical protein